MTSEQMANDKTICNPSAPLRAGLQSAIRSQDGKALVIALLALALGVMLVTGFLYYVSVSQRAVSATREQTVSRYSADAGVEHAIWRLTRESGFTQTVTISSSLTYTRTINGQMVVITVTRVLTP